MAGEPPSEEGSAPSLRSSPELWGLTVRQLQDFYDEIRDDLYGYCRDHGLSPSRQHVCWSAESCPHEHCDVPHTTPSGLTVHEQGQVENLVANMHVVVSRYIKPRTSEHGCSYALMLNGSSPKRATHFISHCWNERFGDLVLSLGRALGVDDVIWVCSFAIDQNASISSQLGTELDTCPFALALKQADAVLCMVDEKVEPFTRAWCVFELYLALRVQKHVELWAPTTSQSLMEQIEHRANALDISNCLASNPDDRSRIMSTLGGSAEVVNLKVRQLVHYVQRLRSAIVDDTAQNSPGAARGSDTRSSGDTPPSSVSPAERLKSAVGAGNADEVRAALRAGAQAAPAMLALAAYRDDAAVAAVLLAAGAMPDQAEKILMDDGRSAGKATSRMFNEWRHERELREGLGDVVTTPAVAKLMLLGTGRAGKTSLLKALSGAAFDVAEASTLGAAVCSLKPEAISSFGGWRSAERDELFDAEAMRIAAGETGEAAIPNEVESVPTASTAVPARGRIRPPSKSQPRMSSPARGQNELNRLCHELTLQRGGAGAHFEVFDFGGQDCYWHSHQLFITDRGLYLVVTNLSSWRSEEAAVRSAGELRFWLSNVRCHAPTAPCFVVGTHKDRLSGAEFAAVSAQLNSAIEDFLAVAGSEMEKALQTSVEDDGTEGLFFPVDNSRTTRRHGIDTLRSKLEAVTSELVQRGELGQQMPLRWLRFASDFREREQLDHLQERAEHALAVREGQEEVAHLVRAMQVIGRTLWFEHSSTLRGLVVEPGWFIAQLGRLLTFARRDLRHRGVSARALQELRCAGVVVPELLDAAWADEASDVRHWLCEAMQDCHLLVDVAGRLRLPALMPALTIDDLQSEAWEIPVSDALVATFANCIWPIADPGEACGLPIAELVFPVLLSRLCAIPGVEALEVFRDAFSLDVDWFGVLRARIESPQTLAFWAEKRGGGRDDQALAKLFQLAAENAWSLLRDRLAHAPSTLGPACVGRPLHAQPLASLLEKGSSRFATCICQRRLAKAGAPGWVSCWSGGVSEYPLNSADARGAWVAGAAIARGGFSSLEEYRRRARMGRAEEERVQTRSPSVESGSDRLSGRKNGVPSFEAASSTSGLSSTKTRLMKRLVKEAESADYDPTRSVIGSSARLKERMEARHRPPESEDLLPPLLPSRSKEKAPDKSSVRVRSVRKGRG